jgi:predicted nucleotidyltransferase
VRNTFLSKELKQIIKALKSLEENLKNNYKVEIIGIFGSYFRGVQKKGSEIDILVRFREGATLFDFVRCADMIEETLHHKVDIVPIDTVREEIREDVMKEAVYL